MVGVRIQSGQLISLGYGKHVRSDEVVAVEPITEDRGPGRRTLVWVRGLPEPLIASRSENALVDDLVTPADQAARVAEMRRVLDKVSSSLGDVPPLLRRVIKEESGVDVDELSAEADRAGG